MNPQIPNVAVIASSVVLLLGLIGVQVGGDEVQQVLNALLIVLITAGGIWSWFKTKFLVKQVAGFTAALAPKKAPAKKKKK